jgi:hypothetical protein
VARQIKLQRHRTLERKRALNLLVLPPLQHLAVRQAGNVIRHSGAGDQVRPGHTNKITLSL